MTGAEFTYGKTKTVARADDDTKAAVEGTGIFSGLNDKQKEYLDKASQGLLDLAEIIMKSLEENGLSPSKTTREGKEYTPTAEITAAPMYKYNHETKQKDIPILDENKRQKISLKITIPNENNFINIYADRNISDGIKPVGIQPSQWVKDEEGKNKLQLYPQYTDAPIQQSTKDICNYIYSTVFERTEHTAYIDKESREAINGTGRFSYLSEEQKSFLSKASSQLLEKATSLMSDLKDNNLSPTAISSKGEKYSSKAVVTAIPSYKYNQDTKQKDIPSLKKNGTPFFDLHIFLKNNNEDIVIKANEAGTLTEMSVTQWNNNKATHFDSKNLESAPLSESTKSLIDFVKNNYIEEPQSNLSKLVHNYNLRLREVTDKVFNKNNEMVNDAYASYEKDNYGEKIKLRSHNSRVVIELGVTKAGEPYAKAIDFGAPKDNNNRFPYKFLNNAEDIATVVRENNVDKHIVALVAEYKGIDLTAEKQQTASQPAPTMPVPENSEPTATTETRSRSLENLTKDYIDMLQEPIAQKKVALCYNEKSNTISIGIGKDALVDLGIGKNGKPYVKLTERSTDSSNASTSFINEVSDFVKIPDRDVAEVATIFKNDVDNDHLLKGEKQNGAKKNKGDINLEVT